MLAIKGQAFSYLTSGPFIYYAHDDNTTLAKQKGVNLPVITTSRRGMVMIIVTPSLKSNTAATKGPP